MRLALLGLGKMGVALARLWLQSGHEVTVWNRTAAAAKALGEAGAQIADKPAEAVAGMPVIFTMLTDDTAVKAVVLDEGGILQAMEENAIHVSLSTISVTLSRQLTEAHRQKHQHFVAAPVFGRPRIAEQGKLWIAVGRDTAAVGRVCPQ